MRLRSPGAIVVAASLVHATGCGDAAPAQVVRGSTPPPPTVESCAPGELEIESGCLPAGMQENGCAAGELALASGACLPAGETESGCAPGTRMVRDACAPAGWQDDGCAAGELADDGGACVPAGVPPEQCGIGFVADQDGGCDVVLPADPCPEGSMAIPGEVVCREVAPCSAGTWGAIVTEASTQYVDAAYGGGDGDGTFDKPWTTIQAAVDAAAPGAIVAIAAGSYAEDVDIGPKAVRLWGRCPGLVEIAPVGSPYAAVWIHDAMGAEVHDLAIRSDAAGLAVDDSAAVVVSRVWVHDTGSRGHQISDSTAVTLQDSLVEHFAGTAIGSYGSEMEVTGTVVRDSVESEPNTGRGLDASTSDAVRSDVVVRRSVFRAARDLGVVVFGSDAVVEDTAVLGTKYGDYGPAGVVCAATAEGGRADLTVRGSLIRGSHDGGVQVFGSDALVETTTIDGVGSLPAGESGDGVYLVDDRDGGRAYASLRAATIRRGPGTGVGVFGSDLQLESVLVRDTQESPPGDGGDGVYLGKNPAGRSTAILVGSLVESSAGIGILSFGSDLDLEATAVRGPASPGNEPALEWGVGLFDEADDPSVATLRTSSIERATRIGMAVMSSQADIESTLIVGTRSVEGSSHGLHLEGDDQTGSRSSVSLRKSRLEANHGGGIATFGSDATVVETAVSDTQVGDQGAWGRGIAIAELERAGRGTLVLASSVVEDSHEAGIVLMGSDATVTGTLIQRTDLVPVPLTNTVAGIVAQVGVTGTSSTIHLVGSVVAESAGGGVTAFASEATLEGCIVRGTSPGYDGLYGRGLTVQTTKPGAPRAKGTIRSSIVEGTADSGIAVLNADLLVEAVVVRKTTATLVYANLGIGIFVVREGLPESAPVIVPIRGSIIEDTFNVGVLSKLAQVNLETVVVRRTRPGADGRFGDGICALSTGEGSVTVVRSLVEDSARAGISSFGSSVDLEDTTLECNPIALHGDASLATSHFEDGGGNVCGCDGETAACAVVKSTLAPPTPPAFEEER